MSAMVLQTLRQVVGRELTDHRIMEMDEQDKFPMELIQKLLSPDVGLHLIFLPEDCGGLGGGARDICRVSEEMAAWDLGVATAFLAICLGTDPILVGGTPAQKQRWLSRIATEGLIVAYGVTEPEAGSNVSSLKTTADQIIDASGTVTGYRLNGAKQFITNGGVADLYTILAKTPAGPSFFAVEKGTPGLSVGKKEDKHGIRASNTTGVLLEDVEVPLDNLIGGVEGQGLKQANAVFGYTRLMVGAFGLGGGQAPLRRALAYGKTREQFGAPLVEKEGYLLKLLVDPWIDLAAGRAYMEQTALRIDEGHTELTTEGSIAKYWCTEAGNRAADAAIQALGGYGYAREYLVEKMRRDVRITTIYEGTSEIQQSIISMFRWKETVRSKGEFYGELAGRLDALAAKNGNVGAALLAASVRALNETVLAMHRAKLTRSQMVMFTFADMMTVAEVGAAFAEQAATGADDTGVPAATLPAMSRAFARKAARQVRQGAGLCAGCLQSDGQDGSAAAAAALLESVGRLLPASSEAGLWDDMNEVGLALKALA
ncbi:MAG: acyl-CoA dehydrogenase family protein [bacterium]|nr:acyl-CoA dehydrogenase family protein [bacterium]MBK9775134.1 acyl-CoA dehydrogenase family protein [bacterium]